MRYLIAQITPAIDFNRFKESIPGLKTIFQPGTNVFGPLPPGETRTTAGKVGLIISTILPYLYVIAGLLLLFYLIYGGFHMMTAANDEKGLVEAKKKITNALVGFLILFLAYWIVQIVEYILGIQIF